MSIVGGGRIYKYSESISKVFIMLRYIKMRRKLCPESVIMYHNVSNTQQYKHTFVFLFLISFMYYIIHIPYFSHQKLKLSESQWYIHVWQEIFLMYYSCIECILRTMYFRYYVFAFSYPCLYLQSLTTFAYNLLSLYFVLIY